MEEIRKCPQCGKEFKVKQNFRKRFCSSECSRNFHMKKRRKTIELKKCLWCHKEFESRNPIKKYCSRECGNLYIYTRNRVLKYVGDNNELLKFREQGKNYTFPEGIL